MYFMKDKMSLISIFETKEDAFAFFETDDIELTYVEELPKQTGIYGGHFDIQEDALGAKTLVWIENPPPKPTTPKPLTDIELLQAQNKALSDRTDFLEDCIAEMAMEVYGGV